jgi:hypothetical protein
MSRVKKGVYGFMRGSFLTDEAAFKNWRIIIFIVGLLLIMISSGHQADKKAILITDLNIKKRELREEYVNTSSRLERMEMESSVKKKVKSIGIEPSKTPPKKIKVTYKDS